MESIVLRYDKGESIGSINSVDTGMATAIIDSDDVLSQLQINQLIAIQSPKSGRYIIAMIVKIYRKATDMTLNDDEDEEEGSKTKIQFAPLAVFCTFFVAELGDKTQLTAITFGANEGMKSAFVVWIGCSLGLFAADILGMLVGYLLKSKTPDGLLNTLAFVIFSIFGAFTLHQGLNMMNARVCPIPVWPVWIAAAVIFTALCAWIYIKRKKENKCDI